MSAKPCPVCDGPALHAKPDGRLYEVAHPAFCTPALRSLVRETNAEMNRHARVHGPHLPCTFCRAVRRFRKERAR